MLGAEGGGLKEICLQSLFVVLWRRALASLFCARATPFVNDLGKANEREAKSARRRLAALLFTLLCRLSEVLEQSEESY